MVSEKRKKWLEEYYQRPEVKQRRRLAQRLIKRPNRYPKMKETHKLWRMRNKNRIRLYAQKRRLKKEVRILDAVRSRLYRALTRQMAWKSGKTIEMLGCSIEEFKSYLQSKFQPGMSWDNWNKWGWHIDHIKPLATFNLIDPKEQAAATHFSNLQPMWAKENLSKGKRWQ